ncbi:polysaccharide deacetylase family protein [Brevibacillus marinus]|uniref:polysaccharide deacetylase family protein n=1 Tax=Brevibacillus marinus TaxID=2496837 RepID=UPI000F81F343|nr:polysaccharide deacetylase family protein [Brevibacillus marinus]
MKLNAVKFITFSVVWGILLVMLVQTRPVAQYVSVIKEREVGGMPSADADDLRRQVEEWKKQYDQPPIDAKLDRIWKAIPGYNGRQVDVEASIRRILESGLITPQQLVYKEIPPAVSLDDLGAQPIYRGNPQKPAVSFMVNVAWGNEYLPSILDTLDKYQVKTTFFLDGSWVTKYPDLAKQIYDRGHEIGNHAFSHPDMSRIGEERIREEIGRTQAVIEKVLDSKPLLFAPPSGAYTQRVVEIAQREFGMKTILWTADTVDWRKPAVPEMVQRVNRQLGNGVLVLMHPTEAAAKGLEAMLKAAIAKGLLPTTVSDVLSSQRIDRP